MPYEEFIGWTLYFSKRPVGWREDQRTYLLLSVQGVKKKPQEIFPSLAALYSKHENSNISIDPNFLKLLKSAKQGDQWDPELEY